MSKVVLKAINISKQYRLGQVGTGTISHDLNRWWHKARGKEDPYIQVGDTNDRSSKGSSEYVWSLKDINFEIKQGEILGIIGKNGAGKSTLLKILSQVTTATTGKVKIRGRIAALLEVGTGFHPELTGRENIFLNGAILGMTKPEITKKFDEIVDFSGVERYIDTPVKRYSSGMMVRLGFAVAAHLEPEILVIDEVLAVGDAEFQKKCLGKMKDVAGEGRTVLFVSHNIQAISNLCNTGLLLNKGQIELKGNVEDCIKKYMLMSRPENLKTIGLEDRLKRGSGSVIFEELKAVKNGNESWEFNYDEDINFKFKVTASADTKGLGFYLALRDPFSEEIISNFKMIITENMIAKGDSISFTASLPKKTLRPGQYGLYFTLSNSEFKIFHDVLDNNVNIPMLNINPVSMDVHENIGFVTMPFNLKIDP
ncbi:MAG: ABC transporter ATP-binding protein [Bacteroidetes bacterium]|nr:ABC transporter ATP-binding protein [Bacteroidota bacterium]